MNPSTWHLFAIGATARARAMQTRSDVLDMIERAEIATDDANHGTAEEFDAAAPIAARNLRGAYDARHLLGAGDLLRLAYVARSARRTFAIYINLPEELDR